MLYLSMPDQHVGTLISVEYDLMLNPDLSCVRKVVMVPSAHCVKANEVAHSRSRLELSGFDYFYPGCGAESDCAREVRVFPVAGLKGV